MHEVDPRFKFAAERTMLAWIRTGLALMGLGFVVARYSDPIVFNSSSDYSLELGVILLGLGSWTTFFLGINYYRSIEKMKNNESILDHQLGLPRFITIALSSLGVIIIFYLVKSHK